MIGFLLAVCYVAPVLSVMCTLCAEEEGQPHSLFLADLPLQTAVWVESIEGDMDDHLPVVNRTGHILNPGRLQQDCYGLCF